MTHTLFATSFGNLIDFRDIEPAYINLLDISHHLTNIMRFGGCLPLNVRYSVASHSLNCYKMAKLLFPNEQDVWRTALMHDATEAYLGDVVSGLKTCLPEYKKLENHLWSILKEKYRLNDYSRIGEIDKRIMLDEAKALLTSKYPLYLKNQSYQPYDVIEIIPDKRPDSIQHAFLMACDENGITDY